MECRITKLLQVSHWMEENDQCWTEARLHRLRLQVHLCRTTNKIHARTLDRATATDCWALYSRGRPGPRAPSTRAFCYFKVTAANKWTPFSPLKNKLLISRPVRPLAFAHQKSSPHNFSLMNRVPELVSRWKNFFSTFIRHFCLANVIMAICAILIEHTVRAVNCSILTLRVIVYLIFFPVSGMVMLRVLRKMSAKLPRNQLRTCFLNFTCTSSSVSNWR